MGETDPDRVCCKKTPGVRRGAADDVTVNPRCSAASA